MWCSVLINVYLFSRKVAAAVQFLMIHFIWLFVFSFNLRNFTKTASNDFYSCLSCYQFSASCAEFISEGLSEVFIRIPFPFSSKWFMNESVMLSDKIEKMTNAKLAPFQTLSYQAELRDVNKGEKVELWNVFNSPTPHFLFSIHIIYRFSFSLFSGFFFSLHFSRANCSCCAIFYLTIFCQFTFFTVTSPSLTYWLYSY